jgi:hypothetical protein
MVYLRSCVLAVPACLLFITVGAGHPGKFYPDDPAWTSPEPRSVGDIQKLKIYDLFDYLYQSGRQKPRNPRPSLGVNTLGEVPDSAWFTNRHGRSRMTPDALKRGAGNQNAPVPPYVIVGAKTEGITPGFRMKDSRGRLYFVKPDPITNPELNTAADVIGSKFFYAIGYHTPENYIVRIRDSDWTIDKKAKIIFPNRISRRMQPHDLRNILSKSARQPDGAYRVAASLAIAGRDLGPFRYEGTRSDDPNDTIPHEDRRDLRGLFVFCAWLNHTDAKGANTLNALVRENGIQYVRHYLIDFGSALGSDGDAAKDARFGNAYQIPAAASALRTLLTLGLSPHPWERAKYPELKAAGRLESELFDPEQWRPNYPNPAFLNRRPDDEFWAARIVTAFTDEDIRALVETGDYSDPHVVEYLVRTLAARRDKIGRTYFSKVLPLDAFRVADGRLQFEDLSVLRSNQPARDYVVSWSKFDNGSETHTPLPTETSLHVPKLMFAASEGDYFAARIFASSDARKTVTVYLRKKGASCEIVGIEREW